MKERKGQESVEETDAEGVPIDRELCPHGNLRHMGRGCADCRFVEQGPPTYDYSYFKSVLVARSPHKREDRGSMPRPGGDNLGVSSFTCSPCSPSSE